MLVGGPINCSQQLGIAFSAYFILFSTFIPISLIVSIEFVKIFQGYFMSVDK
jgi:magnesium-transporting ATPase (P-type)